jgi:uncharacterized protein
MGNIVRMIYTSIGFISLGLGVIGIALPVLPTTPFLLLASFCFMKGSKKFDAWFRNTAIYRKQLEPFLQERALTVRAKITILLFADVMIAIPFIRFDNVILRAALLLIVIYKYYYFIVKIKNKTAK